MFITENPADEEVKEAYTKLLNEDMEKEAKDGGINLSVVKAIHTFKELSEEMKLYYGFPPQERVWTAAWKVTV